MRTAARAIWASAIAAMVASVLLPAGAANAGTMFFLNGTDPIPLIAPPVKSPAWMAHLLRGRFADDTAINVDYPASVWPLTFDRPTMGRSIHIGADETLRLLRETAGEKTVVGISQGAMVIDLLQRKLSGTPDAGQLDALTFVTIADPNRPGGIFTLLPAHTYIPILNITNDPPADSPYDTTVLVQQYDGVADFPDRPWNVLADANAAMGILYYHAPPDWYLDVEIPSSGGLSVTNAAGGTTTTFVIASPHLPLTQPLRDIGVPPAYVDQLDAALRPVIDAGYSRLTPDAGPHIEYGRLVGAGTPADSRTLTPLRPRRSTTPRPTASAQHLTPVASQSRSALRPGR